MEIEKSKHFQHLARNLLDLNISEEEIKYDIFFTLKILMMATQCFKKPGKY